MPTQCINPFNLGGHQYAQGSGHQAPYPLPFDMFHQLDTLWPCEGFEVGCTFSLLSHD